MDFEQFKTSVDNMYMKNDLSINNNVIQQILLYIDNNNEIKEILGHQQNLFFVNEKNYLKDYVLKRAVLGSAIDDTKKQNLGLQLSRYIIDKYNDKLDYTKLFEFIKKNVSFQAALNKTEKKFFVYSFQLLCFLILNYSSNQQLNEEINIELVKMLNKNNLFKIQLSEIIFELKISFNKIQKILEFCLNSNMNESYENFILCSQVYVQYHTQMKNQEQKQLQNKLQQSMKLKSLQKILDEIFEDQNLKGQEKNSVVFKTMAQIMYQMQNLDLLIHIFNTQKEKLNKTKNKQRLFNLFNMENTKLKQYDQNDKLIVNLLDMIFFLFEENQIKKIKGVSQLEVIQATEKMLNHLSQVQCYKLAQQIIQHKKFLQLPANIKQNILQQLQENELVQLVKSLLDQKKTYYQNQDYQNYKQSIHNILNFITYIKSDQVCLIVFTKIFKIYANTQKIVKNFKDLLQDVSLIKATFEFQTFLYNHLSESLFQIQDFTLLKSCISKWITILKVEDMNEFLKLSEQTKLKNENLANLLLCLGFQNYLTEDKDYQSDFQIFCGNFCEEENLETSDYEILVDCIISLMAVQNKNLRHLILQVFKSFVANFDVNILDQIEQELFRPLKSSIYNTEQDMDLDDELELDEDQEDIVVG